MPTTRLNKFLALHANLSRRHADEAITAGRVLVNGELPILGAQIGDDDVVKLDNHIITPSATKRYVAFHKPTGYVCSRRAQGETPTIFSLLPSDLHDLNPVGRLDKNSSGILLLTNDGDFAHQMTHPSFYKRKVYEVTLDTKLAPLHRQMISDFGVVLEDGKSKFELEKIDDNEKYWQITMSEGRNRQIRRTFLALGYTVETLHRIQFGDFQLGTLAVGEWQSILVL